MTSVKRIGRNMPPAWVAALVGNMMAESAHRQRIEFALFLADTEEWCLHLMVGQTAELPSPLYPWHTHLNLWGTHWGKTT